MKSAYNTLNNKKILITCGPTWVPIDPVRVISNISSGELGHKISHQLCREKAQVTLLRGPGHFPLRHIPHTTILFYYYRELKKLITQELKKTAFDAVIHAAAVSDYELCRPSPKKIDSRLSTLSLKLTPTEKIIDRIKELNPKTLLVGFKLETIAPAKNQLSAGAEQLMKKSHCDLVVVNYASAHLYQGKIYDASKKHLATEHSRDKMAQTLVNLLRERL